MIRGLSPLFSDGSGDASAPVNGRSTRVPAETSRLGQLFAFLLGGAVESTTEAEASDGPAIDAQLSDSSRSDAVGRNSSETRRPHAAYVPSPMADPPRLAGADIPTGRAAVTDEVVSVNGSASSGRASDPATAISATDTEAERLAAPTRALRPQSNADSDAGVAPTVATETAPAATETKRSVRVKGGSDPISALTATHDGLRSEDLEGLDPEFARRLERVIARMEAEFGSTVEVIETIRSPERQADLFAQGRTRPGPVVTWTMDSKHLYGRAADVRLNGSWHDAGAYQLLERVASDEGLRTLGPQDPGHIELPEAEVDQVVERAPRGTVERVARPARVASAAVPIAARAAVASVARPAAPAVAGVTVRRRAAGRAASTAPRTASSAATPTRGATDASPSTPSGGVVAETIAKATTIESAAPRPITNANTGASAASLEADAPFDSGGASGRLTRAERGIRAPKPTVEASSASDTAFAGARVDLVGTESAVTRTSGPLSSPGADSLDRVARVMDLQAQAPNTSRLDIPDIDGQGTRLRMNLTGSELDALLEVGDPVALRRMRTRVDQLHRALEGRGLEIRALDVRPTESARLATPGTASAITAGAVTEGSAAQDADANGDGSSRSHGEPESQRRDRRSPDQQPDREDP